MTATTPLGKNVNASASTSVSLDRFSDLTLTVTITLEGGDGVTGSSPGDRIKYDLNITNDGTITLTDLIVADSLLAVVDNRQENAIAGHIRLYLGVGGCARVCTRLRNTRTYTYGVYV